MAKCCVHFLERWCRACDEIISFALLTFSLRSFCNSFEIKDPLVITASQLLDAD